MSAFLSPPTWHIIQNQASPSSQRSGRSHRCSLCLAPLSTSLSCQEHGREHGRTLFAATQQQESFCCGLCCCCGRCRSFLQEERLVTLRLVVASRLIVTLHCHASRLVSSRRCVASLPLVAPALPGWLSRRCVASHCCFSLRRVLLLRLSVKSRCQVLSLHLVVASCLFIASRRVPLVSASCRVVLCRRV